MNGLTEAAGFLKAEEPGGGNALLAAPHRAVLVEIADANPLPAIQVNPCTCAVGLSGKPSQPVHREGCKILRTDGERHIRAEAAVHVPFQARPAGMVPDSTVRGRKTCPRRQVTNVEMEIGARVGVRQQGQHMRIGISKVHKAVTHARIETGMETLGKLERVILIGTTRPVGAKAACPLR